MDDLSKAARKALRDAASVAYERELAAALEELAVAFQKWREGTINAFDLSESIHEFHQGASRDLYNRYTSDSVPDFAVANAVVHNFISLEDVPEAGRAHVAKIMAVARNK